MPESLVPLLESDIKKAGEEEFQQITEQDLEEAAEVVPNKDSCKTS